MQQCKNCGDSHVGEAAPDGRWADHGAGTKAKFPKTWSTHNSAPIVCRFQERTGVKMGARQGDSPQAHIHSAEQAEQAETPSVWEV